jgi:alpha-tubulin suppressor-like RCC1 family protein
VRSSISLVAILVAVALLSSACLRYSFGADDVGQYGDPTTTAATTPIAMPDGNWIDLTASGDRSCGIKLDRTLWCWGAIVIVPGEVTTGVTQIGTATWRDVALGAAVQHACGIQTDDSLWCWGDSSRFALGVGDIGRQYEPVRVGTDTWTDVASGFSSTCAVRSDASLWCWGTSLLEGPAVEAPTQVGNAQWREVQATLSSYCGIQLDDSLWCWGDNIWAEAGVGNQLPVSRPTQVGTDSNWAALGLGDIHSCAIRTDGTLWCWGSHDVSQTGGQEVVTTPTRIGTADDWRSVTGGRGHTCGIRGTTPASLWCWGVNGDGQLGLGDTLDRAEPTQVGAGTSWVLVAAGFTHTVAAGFTAP